MCFKKLKKNEGKTDRIIRAVVALVLALVSYAYLSGTWQIVGYVLSVISLVTAITGFCGLYALLKIKTK